MRRYVKCMAASPVTGREQNARPSTARRSSTDRQAERAGRLRPEGAGMWRGATRAALAAGAQRSPEQPGAALRQPPKSGRQKTWGAGRTEHHSSPQAHACGQPTQTGQNPVLVQNSRSTADRSAAAGRVWRRRPGRGFGRAGQAATSAGDGWRAPGAGAGQLAPGHGARSNGNRRHGAARARPHAPARSVGHGAGLGGERAFSLAAQAGPQRTGRRSRCGTAERERFSAGAGSPARPGKRSAQGAGMCRGAQRAATAAGAQRSPEQPGAA